MKIQEKDEKSLPPLQNLIKTEWRNTPQYTSKQLNIAILTLWIHVSTSKQMNYVEKKNALESYSSRTPKRWIEVD